MIKIFEDNEIVDYKEMCKRLNEKALTKRDAQYKRWDRFIKRTPIGKKWSVFQFAEYIPPSEFRNTKYSKLKDLILSKDVIEMSRTRFYKEFLGIDLSLPPPAIEDKELYWKYENFITGRLSNILDSAVSSLQKKGMIIFEPTVLKVRENKANRDCTVEEWAYYCSQLEYYKQLGYPAKTYYDIARRKTKHKFDLENAWREMRITTLKKKGEFNNSYVESLKTTIKQEAELLFLKRLGTKGLQQYHNKIFM